MALIELGRNLTEINLSKPEAGTKLSDEEQAEICAIIDRPVCHPSHQCLEQILMDMSQKVFQIAVVLNKRILPGHTSKVKGFFHRLPRSLAPQTTATP